MSVRIKEYRREGGIGLTVQKSLPLEYSSENKLASMLDCLLSFLQETTSVLE